MEVVTIHPPWVETEDGYLIGVVPQRYIVKLIDESLREIATTDPEEVAISLNTSYDNAVSIMGTAESKLVNMLEKVPSHESEIMPGIHLSGDSGKFIVYGFLDRGRRKSKLKRYMQSLPLAGYTTFVFDEPPNLVMKNGDRWPADGFMVDMSDNEIVLIIDTTSSMRAIFRDIVNVQTDIAKAARGIVSKIHFVLVADPSDQYVSTYAGAIDTMDPVPVLTREMETDGGKVPEAYGSGFKMARFVLENIIDKPQKNISTVFIYDSIPHPVGVSGEESNWVDELAVVIKMSNFVPLIGTPYASSSVRAFKDQMIKMVKEMTGKVYSPDQLVFSSWAAAFEAAISNFGGYIPTHIIPRQFKRKVYTDKVSFSAQTAIDGCGLGDKSQVLAKVKYGTSKPPYCLMLSDTIVAVNVDVEIGGIEGYYPVDNDYILKPDEQAIVLERDFREILWGP